MMAFNVSYRTCYLLNMSIYRNDPLHVNQGVYLSYRNSATCI